MKSAYLIALGSNQRHPRIGNPPAVLRHAAQSLGKIARLRAVSPIYDTPPLGPSRRRYANAALILESVMAPADLLATLQWMETAYGRVRRGQNWGARVLDLDIVLWSGGVFHDRHLSIPHPRFRERDFVLRPAARIAGAWRDPVSGLSLRQLTARQSKAR